MGHEADLAVKVDVIDTPEQFAKLADNWQTVYTVDPDAQFFLSHDWLSDLFFRRPNAWFVLAARPAAHDSYCAFFPLRLLTEKETGGNTYYHEIHQADGGADYTGLICDPDCESQAIPAFATYLMNMNWRVLRLKNLRISKARLDLLRQSFDSPAYSRSTQTTRVIGRDGVDNLICPYAELTADFDGFLKERLSANTRQKLRRYLRRVEQSEQYKITLATPETCAADVEVLLTFWRRRWIERKGQKKTEHLVKTYRTILHQAMDKGSLHLSILYRTDAPVAAHASFIDRMKWSLLFFLSGRDLNFEELPAGLVLHGYGIRWAIENDLRIYDFLRGNEPYKYSFGPRERHILIETIRNHTAVGDRVDPRGIPAVLEQLTLASERGRRREAAVGFRQVLDACPTHRDALSGYARLLSADGDRSLAETVLEQLTRFHPEDGKAWQALGKIYLDQGQFDRAERVLRQAASLLSPPCVQVHYNLATALICQGKDEDAAIEFSALLKLDPGNDSDSQAQRMACELLEQL